MTANRYSAICPPLLRLLLRRRYRVEAHQGVSRKRAYRFCGRRRRSGLIRPSVSTKPESWRNGFAELLVATVDAGLRT